MVSTKSSGAKLTTLRHPFLSLMYRTQLMDVFFERSQSSGVTRTPDSFREFSSLVKFDGGEGVGGPCGTSRSWGDLLVHTKTPMESCFPIA